MAAGRTCRLCLDPSGLFVLTSGGGGTLWQPRGSADCGWLLQEGLSRHLKAEESLSQASLGFPFVNYTQPQNVSSLSVQWSGLPLSHPPRRTRLTCPDIAPVLDTKLFF